MAINGVRLATNAARFSKEGASMSVRGGRGVGPTRSITRYPDLETPYRRANAAMVKAGHDWYNAVAAVGDSIRGYGKVKSEQNAQKTANDMKNEFGGTASNGVASSAADAQGGGFWGGFASVMTSWWGG